ncbi:ferric enterobactin receptor [Flavobacterium branchiophilum NBRC 15030 = ATCC 35035]|uniref:Iron complex outermembrane receptor protein n=1 Tax=Flavobacterium branchiophilum TaxID=55197 RepID=A0A543G7C7_9FLAO|nr:TonB-dependent receptor [Flavobacterium branchiophilum]OXA81745.1 ferric enterobactin receptor [Flavobacterium branchiophilum NBRC 15030 = ATCC 35035]TQM41854.1 iron complex outermembrane receptor protein [Flavobacterium branchiophilum]GEM54384.1 collagen-binding protein [Flavobacterium branchiophilum NBRC 15030 = ATCC 35035]
MKKIILFLLLLNFSFAIAQKEVSGKVTDKSGAALPGVNVTEKGATNGVSTDLDGNYKIKVKDGATLVFSYVGYAKVERKSTNGVINVTLSEEGGQSLDEIVVVGTRTAPRSNTTSALPVDVLSAKDLNSTGQATFDKALQYKIPSFNTVQTPVNDATSLLDPYEIRNMGPSRTLVLINGKRKNMSSLVYVQTSPGRGETGADISAIPTDAIERVEILRDGASAQYGSDAIAGVMNIILKKSTTGGSTTFRSGITGKGDGKMLGFSINNGTTVGEKGFINYTIDFSKVTLANRPGTVNADGEIADFGASPSEVNAFLAKYPDAGNINGSPETAAAKFEMNGGSDLTDHSKIYYNAAYVYKKVNSFANYRTPYWRDLASMPYLANLFAGGSAASYKGYVPTFEGDLNDYNATLGYKSTMNGWNTDASVTIGGNQQIYTVSNSQNRSTILDANGQNIYRENSPITFKPGGTSFNHIVGNIDVSKVLSDKVSIGFGSEFRSENFEVLVGDKASYEGLGADSFAGNRPENSGKWNRYNLGAYFDVAYDVNKDFLINGTLRFENYSDFGTNAVWKLSSRYKLMDDKLTFRGSISTGFRAPTLHQIYTQKAQYSFVAGQGIQVSGIINNVSPQARQLGIPQLDAEKSTNITFGVGAKPTKNFNFTLDYYNIVVKDRIVLGDKVDTQFGSVAWFSNSFDSRTSGLDLVFNYSNIMIGEGKLSFTLSGNKTFENKRISPVINNSFGATLNALTFTSRPESKYILGANYKIGKFDFSLNNTYFGKATFKQDGMSSDLRTEFIPKTVTDLGINYNASKSITIALNVNNIFNVLPKWEFKAENAAGQAIMNNPAQIRNQYNLITFNGRYSQMTYDGYHFSQLGTMFNLSLNYKF